MLKTRLCIRVRWLKLAPPQVSVPSLLETSYFTALQCFEFSDGNLGVSLAGKVRGWPESSDEHQKTSDS